MKHITAILAAILFVFSAVAGTIDVTARIGDNTKSITKNLAKTISTTGAALHFQAINVTTAGATNTISTAVGDVGLAYILNNGTGTVDVGFAADTYVMRLAAGEFAVAPLAPATAAVYLNAVTSGTTNNVEIYVTER
jgi:hypothetical protein